MKSCIILVCFTQDMKHPTAQCGPVYPCSICHLPVDYSVAISVIRSTIVVSQACVQMGVLTSMYKVPHLIPNVKKEKNKTKTEPQRRQCLCSK